MKAWFERVLIHSALLTAVLSPSIAFAQTPDSEAWNFLILMNNYRAQNGVAPLQFDVTLQNSAQWLATDMATHNYYGYMDSLGRSSTARLAAFGYKYTWSEYLAEGTSDAATLFNQWLSACVPDLYGSCTYGYQKVMLAAFDKAIGIGRAYNSSSTDGWYWTFDFGTTLDQVLNATPPLPVISSFAVLGNTTITPGQSVMLMWSVSGAITLSIDNGVGNVSNTSYKTVTPSQTTTYTLTATNAGGSATAKLTITVGSTAVDTQPPSVPTLLSAGTKTSEVDLAWSASTDNVAVTGYQITRNGSVLTSVAASTLSYADTNVSPNTTYAYAVKAFDAAGNYSNASNTIQATTPGPVVNPPVISSFTASPSTVVSGQPATLSWTVTGATSVSLDGGIGSVLSAASKSVSPSQTTTYTLTASNTGGTSSAHVTVTVSGPDTQPPTAPILISAVSRSATEVDLAWGASSDNVGVAGYQISRSGSYPISVSGSTFSYSDIDASPSTSYLYFIRAYDAAGNYSPASNSIQVTTAAASDLSACPAAGAGVFTGCYYNNINLSGNPALTRTDSQINFNWGNGSPDKTILCDNFSVRWEGSFTFTQGSHTFTAVASDGMRIYIDGNVVLDQWHDETSTTYTFSETLSQGLHLVVVDFYEHTGASVAQLSWR